MWNSLLGVLADAQSDRWATYANWAAVIYPAIFILQTWQTNRLFKRQNDIMERDHSPAVRARGLPRFYSYALPILAILTSIITWAGALYLRGNPYSAISVLAILLLALLVVASVPFFRSLRRLIPPDKPTEFTSRPLAELTPDDVVDAIYGAGDPKDNSRWTRVTISGQPLFHRVRYLLALPDPVQVTNGTLEVVDPVENDNKQLKLKLYNGSCFYIDERDRLCFKNMKPCAPF